MVVRRSALDFNDPDSYWMLWWNEFHEILPDCFQEQLYGRTMTVNELIEFGHEYGLNLSYYGKPIV